MNVFDERDIDMPRTVRIDRPRQTFTEDGNYAGAHDTIIDAMTADIQLSLRVRRLVSESRTGVSGDGVWIMYCRPDVAIGSGDRVHDDLGRVFLVDAAADWGTHTECTMRLESREE